MYTCVKRLADISQQVLKEVPLLHLWSLGIEEQFYLFWPLLLLFLIKKINGKWLIWIVISLIMLSVFYAEQQILKNAGKPYYKMPVRACEMFLGALICFLPKDKIKRNIYTNWYLLRCFYAYLQQRCCLISRPNFLVSNALLPCLATALIIYLSQIAVKKKFYLREFLFYLAWKGFLSYVFVALASHCFL